MKSQLIDELIFWQRDSFLKESVDHQPGTYPKEFLRIYVTEELDREGKERTVIEFQVWVQESSITDPRLTGRSFKVDAALLPRLMQAFQRVEGALNKTRESSA